ncbi:MAG: exodeoxyribonuclease VII small subunit [Acidipropionibacterium sp.]|jgi:exodeoxyribonuclease VII small subunit|nr:exodeoxyribonuclease VII small subunit [Acidipropionibacterium sp.]
MTSSTPAKSSTKKEPDAGRPDQPEAEPELGYEQARDELVEVVRKLESGGASLADTMALWERGEKLATICQGWLDGARKRIDEARSAE